MIFRSSSYFVCKSTPKNQPFRQTNVPSLAFHRRQLHRQNSRTKADTNTQKPHRITNISPENLIPISKPPNPNSTNRTVTKPLRKVCQNVQPKASSLQKTHRQPADNSVFQSDSEKICAKVIFFSQKVLIQVSISAIFCLVTI